MPAPTNKFKAGLKAGERQIGCWMSFGEMITCEVMGTTGFDWLLFDCEHNPYDIKNMRNCLSALQGTDSSVAVRVPVGETWIIKQVLDAGAQTVLVPMVESADQARQLVRDVRYPPNGDRGVGYGTTRSARFGQIADYGPTADDQICLLVQVENRAGLAALDEILEIDGIDGVFVGPADLAADHGHLGDLLHPEVQELIVDAISRIAASDKAAGILSTNDEMTTKMIGAGAQFVAVGLDLLMLRAAALELSAKWKAHTG
ncbi:MAG: HpcH/HpaI aldolase/citrate lyase family protein [Paracoccaceae bacterium]